MIQANHVPMKKLLITLLALLIGTAINASAIGSFGSFFEKLKEEKTFPSFEWPRKEQPKIDWPVFKFPKDIFKEPRKTENPRVTLKRVILGIGEIQKTHVTTSVPDGGATLALLGFALIGLGATQRFVRRDRS